MHTGLCKSFLFVWLKTLKLASIIVALWNSLASLENARVSQCNNLLHVGICASLTKSEIALIDSGGAKVSHAIAQKYTPTDHIGSHREPKTSRLSVLVYITSAICAPYIVTALTDRWDTFASVSLALVRFSRIRRGWICALHPSCQRMLPRPESFWSLEIWFHAHRIHNIPAWTRTTPTIVMVHGK